MRRHRRKVSWVEIIPSACSGLAHAGCAAVGRLERGRVEHLGTAAELDAARCPRNLRDHVVDDESDPWVVLDVAVVEAILAAVVGKVVRADTDRPRVGVEAGYDGNDVGSSFRRDGGEAARFWPPRNTLSFSLNAEAVTRPWRGCRGRASRSIPRSVPRARRSRSPPASLPASGTGLRSGAPRSACAAGTPASRLS